MVFDGIYLDWNAKRIKVIIDHYGHQFFAHKKILDLGCGHADISGVLHRLGGDVTAVDARQEHLKIVDKKYQGVKVVKADLDQPWPFFGKTFDLVLDLGLLSHLNGYENHLKAVCISTTYLILETAVLDSSKNISFTRPDNKGIYDGSFNGFNTQASISAIEETLTKCGMKFERIRSSKLNAPPFVYDWTPSNDDSFNLNKRCFWFCTKEKEVFISLAGNYSDNSGQLTNSQVPITHQHLINTNVAALPNYVPPAPPAAPVIITKNSPVNSKIRLFYNYYEDKNPQRKQEIDFCLQKNIDNALFDLVVIESSDNPTFNFMFDKINRLTGPNDISIICNADIFFDNTIPLINKIGSKEVYALSRWQWRGSPAASTFDGERSQDVWVVRGKTENVNGDFQMGKPACDNRIAFEFQKAGYSILNPSQSIKVYHYHSSGIRNYTNADTIQGDYLFVKSTIL
jgi:SAM-dependent methyltransferase